MDVIQARILLFDESMNWDAGVLAITVTDNRLDLAAYDQLSAVWTGFLPNDLPHSKSKLFS